MPINEKIKELRSEGALSQEQLAELLGVSRQAVSKWENGECQPELDNIVRLAQVFGVSTDYLLVSNGMGNNQNTNFSTSETFKFEDDTHTSSFFSDIEINLSGAVYPLATLVYLFLGFYWGLWHPGWVVFIGAWIIEEIIYFVKKGKFDISIYGVAFILYIFIGVVWGYWHPAWIIFIAAWVVEETFTKKKKNHKKNRAKFDEPFN